MYTPLKLWIAVTTIATEWLIAVQNRDLWLQPIFLPFVTQEPRQEIFNTQHKRWFISKSFQVVHSCPPLGKWTQFHKSWKTSLCTKRVYNLDTQTSISMHLRSHDQKYVFMSYTWMRTLIEASPTPPCFACPYYFVWKWSICKCIYSCLY